MSFFLALLMVWCIFGAVVSLVNLGKLKFAQQTFDMVYELHRRGLINNVQAKVFLNDLDNPLNVQAVREVRWQLEDIMRKESLYAQQPSSDR